MANPFLNSSSSMYGIPDQAKTDFWFTHAHVSEEQPNNGFAHPSMVPRTMPNSMSDLTQLPMDRTQSAPASRPRTTPVPDSVDLQRSASDFGIWPATSNDSDYALYSQQSMRTASLQAIPEATVEYTPGDYVNSCIEAPSPSIPFHNMQVQLTPQWCQSSDCSTSPSTPQTALGTPVTQSSNAMSRQSSLNTSLVDETCLRVPCDFQYMPILVQDSAISFPTSSCFPVGSASDSNFLAFTGPASETVVFPAFTSLPVSHASVHALASPTHQQKSSYLAEDMRRSTSQHSESSSSSTRSASSRQSRRALEVNAAAASRPLAPRANSCNANPTPTPTAQMAHVVSPDGSSKTVGIISKTPYVRPQHPKIMCQHCDARPDGFRGTHELDRHIARAHAAVRKGYICIAPSFNKSFLDACKHCRGGKVYGAYYNAAAHLRRAHFHPRKRGRKGKNDEKRGGIGGGDHPAMEWLKEHWIREVQVPNRKRSGAADAERESDSAPESMSMDGVAEPEHELENHPSTTNTWSDGQQALPHIPLDYGLSEGIQPVDVYDDFAYAAPGSTFEFDAYGMSSSSSVV